jgi:pimeloyl-ACP methyl ester carboxylesterase
MIEHDARVPVPEVRHLLPPGKVVAAGARMLREQPDLAFLYGEIDALNPRRERAALGKLIASCGTVSEEEARGLAIPILFIAGAEDIVIQPPVIEAAAACFTNARFELVPEAGHSVYFERAEAYNALVERFLQS